MLLMYIFSHFPHTVIHLLRKEPTFLILHRVSQFSLLAHSGHLGFAPLVLCWALNVCAAGSQGAPLPAMSSAPYHHFGFHGERLFLFVCSRNIVFYAANSLGVFSDHKMGSLR